MLAPNNVIPSDKWEMLELKITKITKEKDIDQEFLACCINGGHGMTVAMHKKLNLWEKRGWWKKIFSKELLDDPYLRQANLNILQLALSNDIEDQSHQEMEMLSEYEWNALEPVFRDHNCQFSPKSRFKVNKILYMLKHNIPFSFSGAQKKSHLTLYHYFGRCHTKGLWNAIFEVMPEKFADIKEKFSERQPKWGQIHSN